MRGASFDKLRMRGVEFRMRGVELRMRAASSAG